MQMLLHVRDKKKRDANSSKIKMKFAYEPELAAEALCLHRRSQAPVARAIPAARRLSAVELRGARRAAGSSGPHDQAGSNSLSHAGNRNANGCLHARGLRGGTPRWPAAL